MNNDTSFINDTTVPPNKTVAERNRSYRQSPNGRVKRRISEQSRGAREYLNRPFIAWDGEGVNREDGSHDYVLFASSNADRIVSPTRLRMARIFETLLSSAERNPSAIHVIYGGGYDFNMFLGELSRSELETVYRAVYPVELRGYRIGWRPGKSLFISDGRRSITVYDVISFFQCSYVKACDKYLGKNWPDRDEIIRQKANRSSFSFDQLDEIIRYNDSELANLVRLMDELRLRLDRVDLRLSRWDGPGAIAAQLLTNRGVKQHKSKGEMNDAIQRCGRVAYAGGRFEVIRFGRTDERVYEYDINSAYPSAMRELPSLAGGKWTHRIGDPGDRSYALYRLRWHGAYDKNPGPLFYRHRNGTISYPVSGEGWYWSPEYRSARAYCRRDPETTVEVIEAYVFTPATDIKPFAFVDNLYLKRLALKKAGDGAEMGLKLALNSLYGKLAQQVGWREDKRGRIRIPPFHQLEWAGFITSHARATVLTAALHNLDAVIAFETDALFSTEPLPVKDGTGLGEWSVTVFRNLTYLQSGIYFGEGMDGSEITAKTRGVDLGQLTREIAEERMSRDDAAERYAEVALTRFVGAGVALTQSFDRWRRWETTTKQLRLSPSGKREHWNCPCDGDMTPGVRLHGTMCPFLLCPMSAEYPVAWINPNPEMQELEDFRLSHYEDQED